MGELHGHGLKAGQIVGRVVSKRPVEAGVLGEDDCPLFSTWDGVQSVFAGGNFRAVQFYGGAERDFGRGIRAGPPDHAVRNQAAKNLAVLHAGPGINDLDVGKTDVLLERFSRAG